MVLYFLVYSAADEGIGQHPHNEEKQPNFHELSIESLLENVWHKQNDCPCFVAIAPREKIVETSPQCNNGSDCLTFQHE